MFAEKLDFLLKLTGTSNSALGRAAHVDVSTVSRLRAGKREPSKRQNFLPLMCDFFSRNLEAAYQKQSAASTICPGASWPEDFARASALLLTWITDDRAPLDQAAASGDQSVARLVSSLADFAFKAPDAMERRIPQGDAVIRPATDGYYYGNEGKRAAVAIFLRDVIAAKEPRTLLLYSDEALDWLSEDASFARQWAGLMQKAILNGNRIRIIHTIGRTLGEMLDAIQKWIGVYVTGAVEPYYCPRLRDGITRRTLFLAPGLSAVTSSSVGEKTDGALNLYFRDEKALNALGLEFEHYLGLCLPLMRILTASHADAARDLFRELMAAEGDTVIAHGAPSLATMPESVARRISERYQSDSLMHMRELAIAAFQRNVERASVYEVIARADIANFRENAVPLSAFGPAETNRMYYTKAEYAAHLAGVAEALEKYERFHVALPEAPFVPPNMALYHKTHAGTLLMRTDDRPIVFAINEAGMTAAFSDYLARQVAGAETPRNRKSVIARLKAASRA